MWASSYGPDSREQHDNILRLDRPSAHHDRLQPQAADSSTIIFALTADHGAYAWPRTWWRELQKQCHYDVKPAIAEMRKCRQAQQASIRKDLRIRTAPPRTCIAALRGHERQR
jgi:hypothetical protein